MKRLMLLLSVLAIFSSCTDEKIEFVPSFNVGEARMFQFTGDLQVGDYTMSDAAVVVETNKNGAGTMELKMEGVKFSDKMPVTIDITLSGVSCAETDGRLYFSGENIVPLVGGEANSDYTFALLTGWINADASEITFSAKMADDLAPHVAGMNFVYSAKGGSEGGVVTPPANNEAVAREYVGALNAGTFTLAPITFEAAFDEQKNCVDIVMRKVKFAAAMPVTIDITLNAVPYSEADDGTISFEAENWVPFIGATERPDYKFGLLKGTVTADYKNLSIDARMADDLAPYVAGMEFNYNGLLN